MGFKFHFFGYMDLYISSNLKISANAGDIIVLGLDITSTIFNLW